jgi:hypothetical protein
MATTPTWITLVTASSFGGLITGFVTFLATVITLRNTNRVADDRWDREWDREQARWAREDAVRSSERTQQRLAGSYLEVLRIAEREGQWAGASIRNWEIAAEEAKAVPDPDHRPAPGFERITMPEPAVTDRATIAAHLAAFGSDNVRTHYDAWRSAIDEIMVELAVLRAISDDAFPEVPSPQNPTLLPNEHRARQELADAIAKELGHR